MSVTLLKTANGFQSNRDVLLLRLPIAQGCFEYSHDFPDGCDFGLQTDFVNKVVHRLQELLEDRMGRDHPDVPLIDLLSWTRASDGFGRSACTPSDLGGTHFATDPPRLAFIQQVLHGVELMSYDRPLYWARNWVRPCSA
jgi:hypothetical protein